MEGHRQVPPSKRSKTPDASWEADEIQSLLETHDSTFTSGSLFSTVIDFQLYLAKHSPFIFVVIFSVFFSNPQYPHDLNWIPMPSFVFWSTFYQVFRLPTLTNVREHSPALLRPGSPTSLRFFEEQMPLQLQSRFQLLHQSIVDG